MSYAGVLVVSPNSFFTLKQEIDDVEKEFYISV